jgi:enamine deaminase RidA (YjgF/YER057c/UK114 family)
LQRAFGIKVEGSFFSALAIPPRIFLKSVKILGAERIEQNRQRMGKEAIKMNIYAVNPDTMAKPRGYSHAIAVSGDRKTIYIGGQNAVDELGKIVGLDLMEQTRQVLFNIEKILDASGAKPGNIVKLNIHILQGQDPRLGFRAFQEKWGGLEIPPAITVLFVAGLGNPGWLVEIDAVAEVAV